MYLFQQVLSPEFQCASEGSLKQPRVCVSNPSAASYCIMKLSYNTNTLACIWQSFGSILQNWAITEIHIYLIICRFILSYHLASSDNCRTTPSIIDLWWVPFQDPLLTNDVQYVCSDLGSELFLIMEFKNLSIAFSINYRLIDV